MGMHTRPGECFAVVVKAGILFLFEGPPSTKSDGGSPFVLPLLKHIAWGERQTTKGRVTMVTDIPRTKITILDVSAIHKKYDLWYWTAMRTARTMDVDPSSPRRAYAKLRGYTRKEANNMTVSEWRAHHYYMWEAIQRNKLLREPPNTEEAPRC